jgi:hypothetical protein
MLQYIDLYNILLYTIYMNIKIACDILNIELRKLDTSKEITICGGAALISAGYTSRITKDIDMFEVIDDSLKLAAERAASELGLNKDWLNSNIKNLAAELPHGWEDRCESVYQGSHLAVQRIGRRDLLFSKIYAACDRLSDVPDVVAMKPTEEELATARAWVLNLDSYAKWSEIVDACLSEIRNRLHGKS